MSRIPKPSSSPKPATIHLPLKFSLNGRNLIALLYTRVLRKHWLFLWIGHKQFTILHP
jgi:hypothetical protein